MYPEESIIRWKIQQDKPGTQLSINFIIQVISKKNPKNVKYRFYVIMVDEIDFDNFTAKSGLSEFDLDRTKMDNNTLNRLRKYDKIGHLTVVNGVPPSFSIFKFFKQKLGFGDSWD